MEAVERRSSGAAERNPHERVKRIATIFIENVNCIPRATLEKRHNLILTARLQRIFKKLETSEGFFSPQCLWRLETVASVRCARNSASSSENDACRAALRKRDRCAGYICRGWNHHQHGIVAAAHSPDLATIRRDRRGGRRVEWERGRERVAGAGTLKDH